MKKIFSCAVTLLFFIYCNAQTSIKMKMEGGVSIVPCKINGLPLSFIFDTGASDVSISITEARFMLKNGYLTSSDIIGTTKFSDATGTISEGIIINLRELEFAGLQMKNIRATVVNSLNAPLLLGQSAIKKLGKFEVNFETNILTINTGNKSYDYSNFSSFQIDMSEEYDPTNPVQNGSSLRSLSQIGALVGKENYSEAKKAIDLYLSMQQNQNSAEAYYYKGRIYNSLSRVLGINKMDAYHYKLTAFNAFIKNQALDPLELRMKSEFYKSFLDLYLGFYDLGAQFFNVKSYSNAYKSFSKAQGVENFILSKNYVYKEFKLNTLDTALVMNIAASSLQASDTINAVKNYRRITDAEIVDSDYERVYEFLAGYYLGINDNNAQAILSKAKAAYPNNPFWNAVELKQFLKNGDKKSMFQQYEELYNRNPGNYANTYNYAVELFNSLWVEENNNRDINISLILISILKSAIAVDPGVDANILLNNHLFNVAADYSTKAALINVTKTTNPDELKKKKEFIALTISYMNQLIPYGEKIIKFYSEKETLTTKQKISYKQTAGYLSDAYKVKDDLKKSEHYDKIITNIKF